MTTFTYEFETLDGWERWTAPNPPEPDKGPPELNIEDTRMGAHSDSVHNGPTSLRFVKHWATWHAGVMRQFVVERDSDVKISAYGRIWDLKEGTFPAPSDPSVHAYFRVGIDPSGGLQPTSTGVVWNELRANDDWQELRVQSVALSTVITVFVGFENGRGCMWNLDKMYAFLDTVTVDIEGPSEPPPTTDKPLWGIESVEDMGASWRIVSRVPKVNV